MVKDDYKGFVLDAETSYVKAEIQRIDITVFSRLMSLIGMEIL